jgi:hypothetical protein
LDDVSYNNSYYAKLGGLPSREMNILECEYLSLVNYSLFVLPEAYEKYYEELKNFCQPVISSITIHFEEEKQTFPDVVVMPSKVTQPSTCYHQNQKGRSLGISLSTESMVTPSTSIPTAMNINPTSTFQSYYSSEPASRIISMNTPNSHCDLFTFNQLNSSHSMQTPLYYENVGRQPPGIREPLSSVARIPSLNYLAEYYSSNTAVGLNPPNANAFSTPLLSNYAFPGVNILPNGYKPVLEQQAQQHRPIYPFINPRPSVRENHQSQHAERNASFCHDLNCSTGDLSLNGIPSYLSAKCYPNSLLGCGLLN